MVGRLCVAALALTLAACAGAMWALSYLGWGEAGVWAWAGAASGCLALLVAAANLLDDEDGGDDE